MSWRRYDDGYEEHEKIVNLIAAAGYEAYYRLGKIHGYCARQRTEGHIPQAILRELGVTKKHLAAMIALELVDQDEQGDLSVHDWADYNPKDATNAERQARFRNARRNAGVTENERYDRNGQSNGPHARAKARGPSRPESQEPSVTETALRDAAPANDQPGSGHGPDFDIDNILGDI